MNIRIIAVVFAGLTLCSCSYWHGAMSYVGLGGGSDQSDQPAATSDASAATPAPAAQSAPMAAPTYQSPSTDDLCRQIARAASKQAAGEGLDAATQQSKSDAAYRNCMGPSAAPAQ